MRYREGIKICWFISLKLQRSSFRNICVSSYLTFPKRDELKIIKTVGEYPALSSFVEKQREREAGISNPRDFISCPVSCGTRVMTALFRPRFPLPLPSSSTSLSGRTIANLSRHLSFPTGSLPLGGKASDIRPIFPNKFFSQTNGNSQANSPPSIVLLSNPNLFPFYLSILFSKQIYIFFTINILR